jgi:hypothetical protein
MSIKGGIKIPLHKSNVVVFRSRGNVKPEEKWSLNGNPVEICDDFVYLGLLFHYNGSFLHSQKSLSIDLLTFKVLFKKFKCTFSISSPLCEPHVSHP